MDTKKIGKFLTELRKTAGLTQEQAALELYVSRENVSKWERGLNLPSTEMLLAISKLYGVSVTEILLGERKTEENKEELDNLSLNIIELSKRKFYKVIKILVLELVLVLILFLAYYFITTYKSTSVYLINGESDNFNIQSGLVIFTKKKTFLKLGNIETTKEIKEYELFYKKDKDITIYKGIDTNYVLINVNKYDKFLPLKDMKDIINNTYLKITYEDKEEIIKLEFAKEL